MDKDSNSKTMIPQASMKELGDGYELTFEIPGVGKGEAELHVENRSLTLRTATKFQPPAGFRPVACEFERANYAISVDLPETADPATLAAKLENGLLRVTVRKRAETQARVIEIG